MKKADIGFWMLMTPVIIFMVAAIAGFIYIFGWIISVALAACLA